MKNLLKSLLKYVNFNVAFKKISGGDTTGTPFKDRPLASQRDSARFVKTKQYPPPPNFSGSATGAGFV